MVDFTAGKLKVPIEIQHLDNSVTFCFIFIDNPENFYNYIVSIQEFLPAMILSGDIIYIAKSNIKSFRAFDTQKFEKGYIWSFDPYTVMGVDDDISLDDLHTQYVNLIKQTHPDIIIEKELHPVFKDLASDITRRIISAYEFIRSEKLSKK